MRRRESARRHRGTGSGDAISTDRMNNETLLGDDASVAAGAGCFGQNARSPALLKARGKRQEAEAEARGIQESEMMPSLLKLAALACLITFGQGFITGVPSATSRGQARTARVPLSTFNLNPQPSTSSRAMALKDDDNNVKVSGEYHRRWHSP